jgi:(p)ppGpp synthase/HD superfamily hydrolase
VALTVRDTGEGNHAVAAAYLHDTVEDTPITLDFIREECGIVVAEMVFALTDTENRYMNRAARKEYDRMRLAKAPPVVQTIKVADLIDNTSSIVEHDPNFARVYLKEKQLLLDVLTEANTTLLETAQYQLNKALETLK